MLDIRKKGKVKIHWKVSPYDYSEEKEKDIAYAFSKKYGVPMDRITVTSDFINQDGSEFSEIMKDESIESIQDPAFHKKLYKEYLRINKIEDYNEEILQSIEDEVNAKIDYKGYESKRRYSIKWIRWSNFQSYGNDNSFDFSSLKGLVLLNGEPANQSGKTTFAVDLIHFLLFGKSSKAKVQEEIFNKYLPDETNVTVKGCIEIDGEQYIIERVLSRPKKERRTSKSKVTQKVGYYHVIKGTDDVEELDDYVESETMEDTRKTNKVIKESIGREDDFDQMMCITGSNLDSLIDEKPTERGRLFSRWIGLLPIEEKDVVAREMFNTSIKPSLLSNQYDKPTLLQEIEAYNVENERILKEIDDTKKLYDSKKKELDKEEEEKKTFLMSRQEVDGNISKIDISTVRSRMEKKKEEGIRKKNELEEVERKIKEIGDVDFSVDEFDKLTERKSSLMVTIGDKRTEAKNVKNLIESLKKGEYCPTCGRKLDNVDNSSKISENEEKFRILAEEGKRLVRESDELEQKIASMKEMRSKYNEKNVLVNQKAVIELNIEKLRNDYRELHQTEKEYLKNAEAIDKNNKIDIAINNKNAAITTIRSVLEDCIRKTEKDKSTIGEYTKEIERRMQIVEKIDGEAELIKNWKIYLELVGKNGISKMVLRNVLPVINARIRQVLDDVCDFDVTVDINARNEVGFSILKDGVSSDLSSGSGFEKTAASLAIISVLSELSTIPKSGGVVYDEVMSRVARENYEKMHGLFEKISSHTDYTIFITHIDEVKDWCSSIITVCKNGNVSHLTVRDNGFPSSNESKSRKKK
jgi:DNA repair exonuclease SbcCD ATPase subunit